MRSINKLSAAEIARKDKPGRYGDGGGLWLQVSQFGTKAWIFRFTLDGRARQMGMGSVETFSLKEARERARQARQLLADGIDPIEAREAARATVKAEQAKQLTFRDAAQKYIGAHSAGWRNAKHAEQWNNTLATYAHPVIGNLNVADIETGHIMKALEPIWLEKTETASRVRGRIEKVLAWATARGFRSGDNPARWRGHLDHMLPARAKIQKVRHHPAMPYRDVPAFMARLRDQEYVSARALEFTVLTAARTGEVIGATWDEIDFVEKIWTVPAERMKAEREHRVPLAERALEILKSLPREGDWVFPGARSRRPLSNMAMLELLRGMDGTAGLTVHGFRSSFRDWAGERTNFARETAESALAHVIKDKTEAAYRRGDALAKRRQLMAAWAKYCAQQVSEGELIPLRHTN